MQARVVLFICIAVIVLFAMPGRAEPVVAQGQGGPQVVAIRPVKAGVSAVLRNVVASPREPSVQREVPRGRRNQSTRVAELSQSLSRDPALQGRASSARASTPIFNFEGTSAGGYIPPDTNGDIGYDPVAGKKYYVQWVNIAYQMWDVTTTPTSVLGPISGGTLWNSLGAPCNDPDGDPIVLFDQQAQRWFMSVMAWPNYPNGPFHQCIAVSQAANPTGSYWVYDYVVNNTKFNDYPKFGVWPDGYYMSANQFNAVSLTWAGAGAYVFERAKLLVGNSSASGQYVDLPSMGGMLPADWDGATAPPAGAPNYFAQVDDNTAGFPQDQLEIWQFHVDWSNSANSTFTNAAALATAAFDSNLCSYSTACIPQPGTTQKLDSITAASDLPIRPQLMHRLQYRNFGSYETLVANHTVAAGDFADHAGIRWYELRRVSGSWSIYQQGTYAPDADHRWMGSIAMDGQGNISLGYSVSSSSIYPSIRYAGRLAGDPLNSLPQTESTLIAGTGSQAGAYSNRWGDYSSMSVDPVDDCTFWYTNEYLTINLSTAWRTRIGSFSYNAGGSNPPPPPTGPYVYYFPVISRSLALGCN